MNRRLFFETLGGAAAIPALARSGPPTKLGIDSYSIRGFRWKAIQLLDYAASLKLDIVQVSHGDFESFEGPYLRKVKDHAARLGIEVEPGFGCFCPKSKGWNTRQGDPAQYLLHAIRAAKTLGSPSLKVFMGNSADRSGPTPIHALMETSVKVLRSVRAQALDAGVKIAIENHGDMQARETKTLIEEAGKDFVGNTFDSGNPVMLMEDPLLALETLGPYVVTSHMRDSIVYEHPRGAAVQWVALGDGVVDFPRLMARFRELCPRAPFQLEILTGSPPRVLPYLETDFWKAFPAMPAAEFARFLALAKNGHPLMSGMMIAQPGKQPPEYEAALKLQQRVDLERSLEYAKKTLNAGVRWRG